MYFIQDAFEEQVCASAVYSCVYILCPFACQSVRLTLYLCASVVAVCVVDTAISLSDTAAVLAAVTATTLQSPVIICC